MKLSTSVACLLLTANHIAPSVNAASIPSTQLAKREHASSIWERATNALFERDSLDFVTLEKRRGGGGGGGRSGGSSGSSSSSGSTSGSGSSSSSSSSGSTSSGSRTGSTSSTSNNGGSTRSGSGSYRGFGGGSSYAGGAATPYRSGAVTRGGITPFLLPIAALSIFSGLWLYSVYSYPFHNPYNYYNRTLNRNQSLPVICLCQENSVCGCDEGNTTTTSYYDALVALKQDNTSRLADVNGTFSLIINGTLDDGTTAPGGTDDVSGASQIMMENLGWCWMMGVVLYTTFAM